MLNIVLIEPEIPQNTGNIARTCAATGAALHIVEPMGFRIDDKKLKRAGLDYWYLLNITYYKNLDEFYERNPMGEFFYATTKGGNVYSDVRYPDSAYLIFGKETKGIDEAVLQKNLDRLIRIPMIDGARSLNLSNAVAVAAYEYLRQKGFADLDLKGKFA